ncbi:capping protein-inhibiting regulator of actin dynamics isoform X2 [Manis pentadactyla]|uniref:capping protein-inhibiting regulator of actin dynamics isoform X2 n=1 Tax=Manis pentadactyla TaxID=143292 RepID=UPI00255C47CC|nr:capping protein-inhibiting regulator of actin dynamics isoform X2 [Manis pentadactyla]
MESHSTRKGSVTPQIDQKREGKFQPFKKFFGKRKKKNTTLSQEASVGKKNHSLQSVSNGTFSSDEETLEDNLRSFNYSMGTRAFSHDSIFIPDGGAESEQTIQAVSQDNILGKVKTFQQQLGKNIKFGQPPPNAIPMKKADRGQARLEEDLFLTSPMETVTQDVILSDIENKPSDTPSPLSPLSLPGATCEMEEKVAPVKPSRPKRHFSSAGTIESVNLDAIPLAIARLDNSAARHKLSVKPKNQRVSKKHRRLAGDQPHKQGGLPSQLSLDQNGHPAEDKAVRHGDEPELQDSEEEKRCQEEYWRDLEAKCRRQKAEAAERRRLEEQRLQALERRLWEESRRQELLEEEGEEEEAEEKELQLGAEVRQRGEEKQRLEEHGCPGPEQREQEEGGRLGVEEALPGLEEGAEPLEVQSRQEAEKQWQEEEERELKELRRLGELEEQRWQEAEPQRLEEERLEELEEQRLREEEEKRLRELQRQEELEEQRHQEEEEAKEEARQLEETEAQWRRGAEECREAPSAGQESQRQLDDNPPQTDFAEKPEEQERLKPEKPGENSEEPSIFEKQSHEVEPSGEQQGEQGDVHRDDGCATIRPPQKPAARGEATPAPAEQTAAAPAGTDRQGEELRWQEVDERQAMPRPYTFQVSSGGKQILFPKVNLSPVTPMKDAGLVSAPHELKARKASPAPHALPSSLSIPHTAILVTGAQLCGPAVNLSQIKDTACKSLLGLSEEKKRAEGAVLENPSRVGSGKARPAAEAPGSVAALAEWASIRSRILRNAEGERRGERGPWRPGAEHAPRGRCDSHGNPRKTPPVNAKFSITPAWQKFSDGGTETSKENAEAESMRKRGVLGPGDGTAAQPLAAGTRQHLKGAATLELTDPAEGYKFAKDLPSFLVPSLADPPQKAVARAEPEATSDSETVSVGRPDPVVPGGEENASPFGIKLRRTNYSLRFHGDQQPEQKRKKRPGGPADGPGGQAPAQGEQPAEGVARPRGPAPAPCEDTAPGARAPAVAPGHPTAGGRTPAPEPDKAASRMPWVRKPALAPKPAGRTPPNSPVSRLSRPCPAELPARPPGRPDPEPSRPCSKGQDGAAGPPSLPPAPPPPEPRRAREELEEEEEEAERRPASPALLAARPEKPSQSPVAGRKEKPVLQSRHSLDGSRPVGKVEAAQPLWITLALKKQKGFREQQATREERKQAREAKQAEKLSKENVSVSPQPGSGCASRDGSLHKPPAQPEEQQPETAVSRLEHKEQLRKANTLPTSVTVEISDSAPPTQLVKEVTKRFSTPDAAPVSTEPAWLALAKRKAKAWSDCPQIIK